MQCPGCQQESPEGQKFCGQCGTPLAPACPACSTANAPGQKFCGECGAALSEASADSQSKSPASYTPAHLAEKILTTRGALEGERKQVTVLFCDLVSSTALAEQLGPETMHDLLNRFFELALAEVHRYEGTINQFLGDGFMALFGAPLAHEDHARRAVLAALGIRQRLEALRAEFGRTADLEIEARMGLNTGPVVVGAIGDNLRMDYTAIGDTTNLAARLQQLAEPGQVLLSAGTAHRVRQDVSLEALGAQAIRGKAEPVEVYRVLGHRPRRSPVDQLEGRVQSALVGRERELAVLRELADRMAASQGQVVAVVGEPGMGKSRLLYEFRRALAEQRVTYLEGRCLPYGSATPYLPIVDIVRANCGLSETDEIETIVACARAALEEVGLDQTEHLPYLLYFLGLSRGTESLAALHPEAIRARTFETLLQLALRGSRRQPIVLVVENVHWIDRASEDFLIALTEVLAGARILLLTTHRPGYRPPWADRSYYTQLALQRLNLQDSLSIVQAVMAGGQVSESLSQTILEKAEGNPFFLEEVARSVREDDHVSGAVAVPDTIQDVLMARIDRLAEEAKRVLQTASVIGREFSLSLLSAVWDGAVPLEQPLAELKRQEFLYEQPGPEAAGYLFRHALTQEVAYESMLSRRRRDLHLRVAEQLERGRADQTEPPYALLAYHYFRAEAWDRAAFNLVEAGRLAKRRYANDEALALFGQVLAILERIAAEQPGEPAASEAHRQMFELLSERHGVFGVLSRYAEERADLERMRGLAEAEADDRRLSDALNGLADSYNRSGDLAEARAAAEAALLIKARIGDRAGEADALSNIAPLHCAQGDFEAAKAANRRALELREAIGDEQGQIRSLDNLAVNHLYVGELIEAEACASAALSRARAIEYKAYELQAALHLAAMHTTLGEAELGGAVAEMVIRLARETGNRAGEGWIWTQVGIARLIEGDEGEAERAFERALALAHQTGSHELEIWTLNLMGDLFSRVDRIGEALAYFERCAERATAGGFTQGEIHARAGVAAATLATGEWERARAHAEQAAALLRKVGVDVQVHGQLVAWRLYQVFAALGDPRAESFWEQARAVVRKRAEAIADPERRQFYLRHPLVGLIVDEAARRRDGTFEAALQG